MPFHLSTCPYCSTGCGLLVESERGRLVGTHPSQGHPTSKGSLCVRGWNCSEAPYDAGRITHPLARKEGLFVPVSEQHAVKEIANRLGAARRPEGGSENSPILFSVGPGLANEDAYAVKLLARRLGARICGTDLTGVSAARRALRRVLGKGAATGAPDSLAETDLLWVFGADLENFPQVGARVTAAGRAGASIVGFDVFSNSLGAGLRTNVVFPPEDAGILALLLQRAAFAAEGIPTRAKTAPGFGTLAAWWAQGKAPSLPDHAWLTDEKAAELALAFLAAKRPAVIIGERWLSVAGAEDSTVQLLQALALLGGEETIVMAAGECNSWGVGDVFAEDSGPSPLLSLLDPEAELDCSVLVVWGDDLLRRAPRADALAAKLSRLETLVVVDRFESDTQRLAHVFLPACCFGETDGTLKNAFGTLQFSRQAVKPPKDCSPESTWVTRIGRRMGIEDWPLTRKQWLEALQTEIAPFKGSECASLYTDDGFCGIPLNENSSLAFTAPTVPVAAPRMTDFPMRLVFGWNPAAWSTGALSQREEILRREFPESTLSLSPGDLKGAGLKAGWPAKVVTPSGEAVLTAREDGRLPEGVALIVPVPGSPSAALRGFYPSSGGAPPGVQPVSARIEKG